MESEYSEGLEAMDVRADEALISYLDELTLEADINLFLEIVAHTGGDRTVKISSDEYLGLMVSAIRPLISWIRQGDIYHEMMGELLSRLGKLRAARRKERAERQEARKLARRKYQPWNGKRVRTAYAKLIPDMDGTRARQDEFVLSARSTLDIFPFPPISGIHIPPEPGEQLTLGFGSR